MSDDSEDDYAEFGTPLDPLDEDECPRKKPLTIEEQFARDKHGRRRFHGAFTGGFSAGFLNTVGSLEGWRPSSFKSSKSEKAIIQKQRPEQFMDEEDVGEFGIAPSILQAKDDYSSVKGTKRKHQVLKEDRILGVSILKTLLQPVRETVGVKLLKKMGWKLGQGVGPRISKDEKKRIRKKVYGCSSQHEDVEYDPSSNVDDDDDIEWENLTFAPDDYLPHVVKPKENVFGMGYQGLDRRSILSVQQMDPKLRIINKKSITGQAFGVGAFEEEDEDIYNREDMSQYDFALEDNPSKTESTTSHSNSDGILDDFVHALKKATKKVFPPPILPKDYKAFHKTKISRFEPISAVSKSRKLSQSPERDNTASNNEKIQEAAKRFTGSTTFETTKNRNFKPFIADVDKQIRYEKYINLVASGKKDELRSLQPVNMTEWEKERERVEFEQAAKLFSPLTGVMQDRFTSATQPDDLNDPLAVVEKLKSGSEEEINAAKSNKYGNLTRKTENWKPASLLCKRFNIPELNINEIPIVERHKKKAKYSIFDNLPELKSDVREEFRQLTESNPEPEPEQKEGFDQKEREDSELMKFTEDKNKIDLFNAIFLDEDSEEEESESEENQKARQSDRMNVNRGIENAYEEKIINEKRNTSPAKGIFENIDYDALLVRKGPIPKLDAGKPSPPPDVAPSKTEDVSILAYGPKLPDKILVSKATIVQELESDIDGWVEKTDRKKKKSKKYKKSKHKSKHKHKKSKK